MMASRVLVAILSVAFSLAACGEQQEQPQKAAPAKRATRITVATADARTVEVTDSAIGVIESKDAPMLTAEVGGRLTKVLVDTGDSVRQGDLLAVVDPETYRLTQSGAAAEVRRLQTLVEQQERQVERNRQLVKENFVSQAALEESVSQLEALRQQLAAARARLEQAQRDVEQTEVRAPVGGVIDQRLVAAGDYVNRGQPLFRLVSQDLITVRLPFPETVAGQLRTGLKVHLTSPLTPGREVTGTIKEIRPALAAGSRALEVIVDITNPGGWRVGASVRGRVVLETRQSVVVPETSVVERPAGRVVYVIEDATAKARKVQTGIHREGWIEILEGVRPGAVVAVDGAAYLTDGAAVAVQQAQQENK
jgi:RND family efflux transporter MFP subunit